MSLRTPLRSLAVTLALSGLLLSAQAAPARHALIVAIGNYPGLPLNAQLEGPAHDAQALRAVLIKRWSFEETNVQVLLNQQASKRNILDAMRDLQTRSKPDDEVLIYFSGHGTSALDAGNSEGVPMPHTSGAFIAADFKGKPLDAPIKCQGPIPDDGLVVGCRDLRPLLDALDNERTGRRKLWVISDSCYSGQQVRSAFGSSRMIPLAYGDSAAQQVRDLALAARQAPLPPFPYRRVQFLAASAQGERASDIRSVDLKSRPTFDGKPHGAFTDALLGVLDGKLPADFNGDGWLSLTEVHRAISERLDRQNFAQTPQRLPSVADDQRGVANEPVLQVRDQVVKPLGTVAASPLRVQAIGVSISLREALRGMPQLSLEDSEVDARLVATGGRLLLATPAGDLVAGFNESDFELPLLQLGQLAWAKQLRQLAEAQRRGVLAVEVEPAGQGGNFFLGQTLSFAARPDREGTLLLLNVAADGRVTTLYPNRAAEAQPKPGGSLIRMPGACAGLAMDDPRRREACIQVSPPLGMDLVMAFSFDSAPRSLAALMSARPLSVNDARLTDFMRELAASKGQYTFAMIQQRTQEPPKP